MEKLGECGREVGIGQAIGSASPVGNRLYEPAPTEAGQLIRHHLPRDAESVGEV